jgi:hypothetical protein
MADEEASSVLTGAPVASVAGGAVPPAAVVVEVAAATGAVPAVGTGGGGVGGGGGGGVEDGRILWICARSASFSALINLLTSEKTNQVSTLRKAHHNSHDYTTYKYG